MTLISGVLLVGKFRSKHDLDNMKHDDQRNTLIVEIAGRSKQTNLQSFNDETLAAMGAVLVFLRLARIRDDAALKGMTADDMRNVLIVELAAQTQMNVSALQGMSNIELVLLGLGKPQPGGPTTGSFIRGVLLVGQFRTQRELDTMSPDDQRNTLIVEMAGHSNQTNFQAFNDFELGGAGAVMVYLRGAGIRTDAQLMEMSCDDQRNTAIVEIGLQTRLGAKLKSLSNMELVLTALGVEPVFKMPLFNDVTLSSQGQFLHGLTAGDRRVVLAPNPVGGTKWRRRASENNLWTLECLGSPPEGVSDTPLFLVGTLQNTVGIISEEKDSWRATRVGEGFTLENRTDVLRGRFLDGRPGRGVTLSSTGTVWTVVPDLESNL